MLLDRIRANAKDANRPRGRVATARRDRRHLGRPEGRSLGRALRPGGPPGVTPYRHVGQWAVQSDRRSERLLVVAFVFFGIFVILDIFVVIFFFVVIGDEVGAAAGLELAGG